MDELIKDFLCQAGGTVMIGDHGVNYETINTSKLDAELFAELIIKECIGVMNSTIDESIDLERKLGETAYWIESDIKQHFGIE